MCAFEIYFPGLRLLTQISKWLHRCRLTVEMKLEWGQMVIIFEC